MLRGSTAPASVLATGQMATFAVGDDGDLRSGARWPDPRFTDNGDGTVNDALTGLMWTQDAGLLANATWTNALASIQAMNAGTGVFGFTDWRLPIARELRSILDYLRCLGSERRQSRARSRICERL